jgi:hypothetical protein
VVSALLSSDGLAWESSLVLPDGEYSLQGQAQDAAGNQATANTRVRVDSTPPNLDVTLGGTPGAGDWYTSAVTLSILASDRTSGVAGSELRLDDGDWQVGASLEIPF